MGPISRAEGRQGGLFSPLAVPASTSALASSRRVSPRAMGKRGTAIQRRKDMHAHLLELEQKDRERSAKKRQRKPEPKVSKGDVVMGGTAARSSKMRVKLKGKKVKLGLLEIKQKKAKRQAERKASKAKAPEAQRPPR